MINKSEMSKYIEFDVLSYSKEAKEKKMIDNSVINATIGMLYYQNELVCYEATKKAISSFSLNNLAYSTSNGSINFNKTTIKHFVDDQALNNFHKSSISTLGGTAAIAMAFKKYLNDDLILPNLSWSNYETIAKEVDKKTIYYEMFKDDAFNIESLFNLVKDQEKPFILLNTPAHNPTGYNIKNDELLELFKRLNNLKKEVVLLLDIAYIDYSSKEFFKTLDSFNGLILIAASYSKALGIYGLRSGALICLSRNQNDILEFDKYMKFYARATWSCPNNFAEHLVIDVYNNQLDAYQKELAFYKSDLEEKHLLFNELAKANNVEYYPSDSGFFITIRSKYTLEQFVEKKVYLLPLSNNNYRVSLSSVTKDEIVEMISRLK